MKKLSELMAMTTNDSSVVTTATRPTLVLFDSVLNSDKVLKSKEVDILANHFFGQSVHSVLVTVYEEQLKSYFQDELYKAGVQSRSMIYPFKARFEDLTQDSPGDGFSGPVYLVVFNNDDFSGLLVFICHWNDDVFTNDSYVVGAIGLEDELKKLIDNKLQE